MIAFTFPGQGSQRPGAGTAWIHHPSWELVGEAGEAAGRDVAHLLLHADADELRETRNAQLATYVTSMIALDAVERLGVSPALVAGHSLGEYSALTAAGVVSFGDGVRLVVERGEAMQRAADERAGSMASVLGLDEDRVAVACARAGGDVWAANYNAPGHTVVAGTPEGLDGVRAVAKELGARKVVPLKVGGAFHSPLMAPARDRLAKALAAAEWRDAGTPVVTNVDAMVHRVAPDWEPLLLAQLCTPVRWRQSIGTLVDEGVTRLIELGPGNVLTGLAKRCAPDARAISVSTPDDLEGLVEELAGPGPYQGRLGEHLAIDARLVLAPAAGVFQRHTPHEPGHPVDPGTVIGHVGDAPVHSAFAGRFAGFLALDLERVTPSQPVAWLAVDGA